MRERNQTVHATLVDELSYLLDRVEGSIRDARKSYRRKRQLELQPKHVRGGSIGRFFTQTPSSRSTTPNKKKNSIPDVATPPRLSRPQEPSACFIDMPCTEETVEDLRRIAELVVTGDHAVTLAQRKKERAFQLDKDKWNSDRNLIVDEDGKNGAGPEEEIDVGVYTQLFDLFFERNALEMIVNMLMGVSFDLAKHEDEDAGSDKEEEEEVPLPPDDTTLLPTPAIATQAIQSIGIMIQNVSRATSLYVILSNNHVNTLIGLPLDLYANAERRLQMDTQTTPNTFSSPCLTELTTHFVTFLKSLALRMTAETLQFFLKYPSEPLSHEDHTSASNLDEDGMPFDFGEGDISSSRPASTADQAVSDLKSIKVDFPLYERALEFCAAHQDSFVRVTAMNICLNTLRLTTVSLPDDEGDNEDHTEVSVPDGVLHTAKPLPFRERFAIAQYACIPLNVERLIAPIFTKLAERWNGLEEQIREIDSNKSMVMSNVVDNRGARNEKAARAKEKVRRERLIRGFKDKAADLQDELLLLDDVFKVRKRFLVCAWV
jgi:hypothetical protein